MKKLALTLALTTLVACGQKNGGSSVQAATPGSVPGTIPSTSPEAIGQELHKLVEIFGTNIGPAAIFGNSGFAPTCKIYLNFLDDGAASPTPGVRFAIEYVSLFVVTAREDFSGFLGGVTPLVSGSHTADGAILLRGPQDSRLKVTRTPHGRPVVQINGLSCVAESRLFF